MWLGLESCVWAVSPLKRTRNLQLSRLKKTFRFDIGRTTDDKSLRRLASLNYLIWRQQEAIQTNQQEHSLKRDIVSRKAIMKK